MFQDQRILFSPLDVCIGVGLGAEETIKLEDDGGGLVKNLFGKEDITISVIVKKLSDSKIKNMLC